MRIGIFGGTFNPPHIGHLRLAEAALKELELEKVVFIPCGDPPHKQGVKITEAGHRYNMVRMAIGNNSRFEISDIEIKADGKSYTAKTLERLEKIYHGDTLVFIVGADSLGEMETWYHPEEIFKRAEIAAAYRGGSRFSEPERYAVRLRERYGARISLIEMPPVDISSSEIRSALQSGATVDGMMSDEVYKYIKENRLYGL